MKRRTYLFPLMAVTALSLSLAACDDKKDETANADNTAVESPATAAAPAETTTPAPETIAPAPVAAAVKAEGASAFATAEGVTNGAAFVTLTAGEADKLIGATTDVATSVEIHENAMDAGTGTVSMRKVESLDLQPGQPVELKTDGYHLMLIGLKAPLTAGQTFNITLDFDKAADVTVPVTVVTAGAAPAADAGAEHDHAATPEEEDVTPAPETTGEAPAEPTPAPVEGTQAPAAQ